MSHARELPETSPFRKRRWLFLLAGDKQKASSRVRGYWIAEEMRSLGQTCKLLVCDSPLKLVITALIIPWFDVVIFQKTYSRHHLRLQAMCRWLGKRTVVDIDDAPSKPNNPVTLDNFHSQCRSADAVFAGSVELAKYTRSYNPVVELVPTGIQCRSYALAAHAERSPVRIVWVGDARQYASDLEKILLPALLEVSRRHEIILRVIGAANGISPLPDQTSFALELVQDVNWSSPEAISALLCEADIGVYPLLPSAFNQHKCGFKALEYMACGLPVIASPNPANESIVSQNVDGFLANSTAQWTQALDKLASDPDLRREMGAAGRLKVTREYDSTCIAHQILDITDREFGQC